MKKKIMIFLMLLFVFGVSKANALSITSDYTLEEDINEQVVVDGANATINLNGHSITAPANGALRVVNGANVTVTGEGTIESINNNGVVVDNGSTFTLESGNIRSVEFGVFVAKNSTFTMNGGTIVTSDNCGVGGNGSNTEVYKDYTININGGTITSNITTSGFVSCGVYHPNRGTVNVAGGTINSTNGPGIVQRAGTLNITGGTINSSEITPGIKGKACDAGILVNASAIVVDKEANYPEMATMVTKISSDAKLNGAVKAVETMGDNVVVELTGGVYSDEPEEGTIPEGYNAYEVMGGDNDGKYVVVKESDLKNQVINGIVPEESVDEGDAAKIAEIIKDKYNLASYYDVLLVKVTPDGDIVGVVSESDEVTVTLGIPENLPKVKDGYARKYYVVRVHNGKATLIKDVTDNGNGTVSFKSGEFSTYALAYEDVQKTVDVPKTFDPIFIYISLLSVSVIGIIGKKVIKNN